MVSLDSNITVGNRWCSMVSCDSACEEGGRQAGRQTGSLQQARRPVLQLAGHLQQRWGYHAILLAVSSFSFRAPSHEPGLSCVRKVCSCQKCIDTAGV